MTKDLIYYVDNLTGKKISKLAASWMEDDEWHFEDSNGNRVDKSVLTPQDEKYTDLLKRLAG
jgi:hypothetical protein